MIPPIAVNLDSMIAASMREIPSDEELSGDDDDPDLLTELSALSAADKSPTPVAAESSKPASNSSLVSMLSDRLKMYQEAEAHAKTAGETTRARRFNRGIKTLDDLLKQTKAGIAVNEEDIPPPVATSAGHKPVVQVEPLSEEPLPSVTSPTRPAPPSTTTEVDKEVLATLTSRRDEYKRAALAAKRAGDTDKAVRMVKVARQFDPVIAAVESGQAVDVSQMPPPPMECEQRTASPVPVPRPQVGNK